MMMQESLLGKYSRRKAGTKDRAL